MTGQVTGAGTTPDKSSSPAALTTSAGMDCAASIRIREVIPLQGVPLLGLLSGPARPEAELFLSGPLLMTAFFLITSHVYTFNDWAGLPHDIYNERRMVTSCRRLSPTALLSFSLLLLAAGTGLAFMLSARTGLAALFIASLSFLYSHRAVFLKGVPIASTLTHFAAGTAYFLFGYTLFNGLDRCGLLTGAYFGLIYAAGHLNHEIMDLEADRRAGFATNALRFGPVRVLYASFLLMSVSSAYLLGLGLWGCIPRQLAFLSVPLFIFYTAIFRKVRRAAPTCGDIESLRAAYHRLYAGLGLAWLALLGHGR